MSTTPPLESASHQSPVHLSHPEIVEGYNDLPPAPTDEGKVVLIVRRPATDARETPSSVELSPERGVPGDGWEAYSKRTTQNQITVIRRDIVELLGNGQPLTTPGDNLVVDLDLSTANLPAGSRLRVGAALVEVTAEPHDGCSKFRARFGADALAFVQSPVRRHLNLRGIHFRVIEAGEVAVGSAIKVLSRTPAAG